MLSFKSVSFGLALTGAALSFSTGTAGAAGLGQVSGLSASAQMGLPIEHVQGYVGQQGTRGYYGRGYRPGYYGRGYRSGYYGRGYRRGGVGSAIGLGLAAGAIGALAAGAYAAPAYAYPAPVYDAPPVYVAPGASYAASADDVAYCSRRFRTYDPATGTYIANDGRPRACP